MRAIPFLSPPVKTAFAIVRIVLMPKHDRRVAMQCHDFFESQRARTFIMRTRRVYARDIRLRYLNYHFYRR